MNRHVIKEANKYMKRCSISLVIREMENESIMRCHSRMVNIENTAKSSAGENVESLDFLYTAGGNFN